MKACLNHSPRSNPEDVAFKLCCCWPPRVAVPRAPRGSPFAGGAPAWNASAAGLDISPSVAPVTMQAFAIMVKFFSSDRSNSSLETTGGGSTLKTHTQPRVTSDPAGQKTLHDQSRRNLGKSCTPPHTFCENGGVGCAPGVRVFVCCVGWCQFCLCCRALCLRARRTFDTAC